MYTLEFQCGSRNSSVDLAISVWILGLEHGYLVSKMNPGNPVQILGLQCEFLDSSINPGMHTSFPVWILEF